ncbi:MAG: VWA domain-containing protein [Phycisphaeraceae bacterium]|nr:VWA domain-containing protein [Phycisphaerales bacterium]MCB9860455.1 VWA domain-containing protein [Phycisphaeraceae bacterium]
MTFLHDFHLQHPDMLWLLTIPAVMLVLFAGLFVRRERLMRRFALESEWQTLRTHIPKRSSMLLLALLPLSIAAIVVGLARPRWNPEEVTVDRVGRDLAFLVDVSRSMLAEDLAPNRLERAKLWIRDLVATLDGDRVSLVAFAGDTAVVCPLTTDYSFFELALDGLNPDSAGRGGTLIGDAIRRTVDQVFEGADDSSRNRDILLFTDGGDQESYPVQAAARAGEAGVRIIAFGLGGQDAVIPGVESSGTQVRSSLDAESLREVALASRDGVMLNVGTGTIELDSIYADLIRTAEKQKTDTTETIAYTEGFQWLLAIALGALMIDVLFGVRA